jgi:Rps23 Pro-64 3,4-dihydroxylase Tpa1-like proline 4-hydroxylase
MEATATPFSSIGRVLDPPADIGASSAIYRAASPFPHLVLDNLFQSDILERLIAEMTGLHEQQWRLVESHSLERVRRMRSVEELGIAGIELVNLLHSASFLRLLSGITGIQQLLPDPYLQGAGYASMRRGDFFKIHTDRSVAYDTGLTRRLAMIIFLNKEWSPAYRGQLELWDAQATRCDVSIEPLFNRTVLFEVATPNFHGVPTPLACPVGRNRKSFIVYYHTVGAGGKVDVIPHSSIFAQTALRKVPRVLALARQVTPPVLFNAAKKLIRRWKPEMGRTA